MHTYVHTYIYIYMYIYTYICKHIYMHIWPNTKEPKKNVALLQVRLFIWLFCRWDSHMAVLQM